MEFGKLVQLYFQQIIIKYLFSVSGVIILLYIFYNIEEYELHCRYIMIDYVAFQHIISLKIKK